MIEEIKDVPGADRIDVKYGERFLGWYFFKTPLKKILLPLNYKDFNLSYSFTLCDYKYKFIMPSKLEFVNGIISYSDAERELGVFRFPRDDEGNFSTPISKSIDVQELMKLTKDDLTKILKRKTPLVFEAFRIPMFGFEFMNMDINTVKELKEITDEDFSKAMEAEYNKILETKIKEILDKISSIPNYLLILTNVLNRQWKNFKEVSFATEKIIHI